MNLQRLELEKNSDNKPNWAEFRTRVQMCSTPSALGLDIDETTVNSVRQWVRTLNLILGKNGKSGPTYEEVCSAGGTDGIYPGYFLAQYAPLKARLMRSRGVNFGLNLTEEHVHRVQHELFDGVLTTLIGHMTARPSHPHARKATKEKLFENLKLPQLPIVMRPENISTEKTTPWKIGRLRELALLRPDILIMMFDDSTSLATGIAAYNQTREHPLPLIQIVYPGPLTLPKIAAGKFTPRAEHGIYLSTWNDVSATIEKIHADWLPNR